MDFGGEIIFRGAGCLRRISKKEGTNLIEMYFAEPDELLMYFDPACFKAIVDTVARFLLTRDETENLEHEKNAKIKGDMYYCLNGEKIRFESLWNDSEGPILIFSNADGKLTLDFNESQAEEIEEICRKIKESERLKKEVNQKKIIEASA